MGLTNLEQIRRMFYLRSSCGESPPHSHFGPRRFVARSNVKERIEKRRAIWKNAGAMIFVYLYLDEGVSVYLCM